MKPSHALVALLFAVPLAAAACANGSTADEATHVADSTKATEPTEPAEENTPIPPASSSSGGTTDAGTTDAGHSTDAGKATGSTGSNDGGTKSPDSSCATVPPSHACGTAPQCGCASTETCDVTGTSNGSVSCIKAGSAAQGTPCTKSTQCAVGLTCAYGTCRPYCSKSNAACTGTGVGTCGPLYVQDAEVPNALVCTITCDPRSPSAACGSNTCIWEPTLNASDCDTAGTLGPFEACSTYNGCKPGLACVNNPYYGPECEPWCRVGVAGDCPASTSCVDVYGTKAPTQGTTRLGNCQ